jgi:hypothetical protein
MSSDILEILYKDGFISEDDGSNLISASKAFFAMRVIDWIRDHAGDPNFNLESYLVGLTYYKLDLAEMKFTEDGDLLYRYTGPRRTEHYVDQMANRDSEDLGEFYRPGEEAPESGVDKSPDDPEYS